MAVEHKYGAPRPVSSLDAKTLAQARQLGETIRSHQQQEQGSLAQRFGPSGGGTNEAMRSLQAQKSDRPALSPDDRFSQRDSREQTR